MKFANLLFVSIFVIGLTQPAFTQSHGINKDAHRGVLGYFDPQTGTFKPLGEAAPVDEAPPPVSPTTGTFVFKLTITLKSSNLASSTVVCSAVADVFPTTSANDTYFETASIEASASGTTRTCTVTIPYSWVLTAASSDEVTLSYGVEAIGSSDASRSSGHTIGTIKVPASGATTTETFAVTL